MAHSIQWPRSTVVATAVLALGAAVGVFMVGFRGLLIEPVVMEVQGPCESKAPCSRVRCVFENQGPVPARGTVIIDTWRGLEDARGYAGVRRLIPVSLGPRERVEHVLDVVGVPYTKAETMVRCMPGYVSGGYPLRETAP